MATITTSLERSLQNCSLNHHRTGGENDGLGRSSSSEDDNNSLLSNGDSDITVELNSHLSLPFDWEQCLDLKTGEIYYINWRNGMKTKEDPRTPAAEYSGDFYSEDDDDDSSFESEESSSESSISYSGDKDDDRQRVDIEKERETVLVVAGCKRCFMYFMVPKRDQDCPKCSGLLVHFDRPLNGSL